MGRAARQGCNSMSSAGMPNQRWARRKKANAAACSTSNNQVLPNEIRFVTLDLVPFNENRSCLPPL